MPFLQQFFGGNVVSNKTATAATVINVIVPPHKQGRGYCVSYFYTPGANDHVLTVMRPLAKTSLSAGAAASQAVINLLADPGASLATANPISANDWLVIQNDDGTVFAAQVSSVAGLAVTLTASLTYAIKAGATVWFYGVKTDTDPANGIVHPQFKMPTGSQAVFPPLTGNANFFVASHEVNQPLLMQSDNVTAAGTMNEMIYQYAKN